ncbi:MAG: asparaginase [Crenarchaeota archaeon]|nr:asparaginase [Thermoproteota archaeon]
MKIISYKGLKTPAIILHGGAGRWLSRARSGLIAEALAYMVLAAVEALKAQTPVEMVVEAVAVMEDSGVFNAGVGSVLNYDGEVEMDAGLMSSDGLAGAVAATRYPRNPIRLALEVARRTSHVIISGRGADKLAQKLGLPQHPGPHPRQLKRYRQLIASRDKPAWARRLDEIYGSDTVGAAAATSKETAAAASTGGITLKHPGRIGDSAIPGAGFYASRLAACSATGIGEQMILLSTCRRIVEAIEKGTDPREAAASIVEEHNRRFGPGGLGVIIITTWGEAVAAINTEAMPVCIADASSVSAFLLH